MKSVNISLSIVLYNQTVEQIETIIKTLNDLQSRTKYNYIFFLIDNNSSQKNISQFTSRLESNYKIIELYENIGFGGGHNCVLNMLESDIHIVMNPDIIINDFDGFDKAIEYLLLHGEIGLLSPKILNTDGSIQRLTRNDPTVLDLLIRFLGPNFMKKRQKDFVHFDTGYDSIQKIENATGSFMILKTSKFKDVNGFDTRYFMYMEDSDLTRTIGTSVFYPYFSVIHEWARENHSIKGILRIIISMIKYFNKWGWRFF